MARLPRGTAVLTPALLLVAVVSVFFVSACGGGTEATETTEAAVPAAGAPAAQPVASTPAEPPRAAYEALVGTELQPGEETPADVRQALEEGRPVVVAFYVPGGGDDGRVRETLDKLAPKYEDINVAAYDFSEPDEFGDLGRLLRIDYPPQLVFVDTNGVVRSVLSGYVDEGTLNQHLVNIRQG
jgi:hypothetical protein